MIVKTQNSICKIKWPKITHENLRGFSKSAIRCKTDFDPMSLPSIQLDKVSHAAKRRWLVKMPTQPEDALADSDGCRTTSESAMPATLVGIRAGTNAAGALVVIEDRLNAVFMLDPEGRV